MSVLRDQAISALRENEILKAEVARLRDAFEHVSLGGCRVNDQHGKR